MNVNLFLIELTLKPHPLKPFTAPMPFNRYKCLINKSLFSITYLISKQLNVENRQIRLFIPKQT